MTRSHVLCVCLMACLVGFSSAAGAVAEAEPEAAEPAAEAPVAEAEPEAAPAAADPGRVARSAFTSEIQDREPTDTLSSVSNDVERVVYFTELEGLAGRTVVHRWLFGGEVMAEVPFEVAGPRWRVHSSKRLDATWLGEWSVSVVADGEVLTTDRFSYTQEVAEQPAEPAPPAAAE